MRQKYLVKVRQSPGIKVSCMFDHVQPTLRGDKPDHIVQHSKANDPWSEYYVDKDIPFISHSETMDLSKHLSGTKLYLNYNGLKVFAEIFLVFLKKFN